MEHRVRSQEPEFRIQHTEENIETSLCSLLATDYWLLDSIN
jgi:hypothetical protein